MGHASPTDEFYWSKNTFLANFSEENEVVDDRNTDGANDDEKIIHEVKNDNVKRARM